MRVAGPADFSAAFDVSRETLDTLRIYDALLRRWTQRINLVSPGSLPELWHRHIADSAQLLGLAPAGARTWTDLGAGAGLPGLVIAAMARDISLTLIESDRRKAAFLRHAAAEMGISISVHACRIEDAPRAAPDVISARALAPLPRLIDLAAPHAGPNTVFLLPKGARVDSELTAATRTWHIHPIEQLTSKTETGATILRFRRPRQTDAPR